MRYQIFKNWRKGTNFGKLYIELCETGKYNYGGAEYVRVTKYLGTLRKDGSTSTKKRIVYGNSRREIIGKLKEKFKHLKKVGELCYDD